MYQKQLIFFLLIAVYTVNSQQPDQFSNFEIFNKNDDFDYNMTVAEYLSQGWSTTTKLRLIFGEYGEMVLRFKDGKTLVAYNNARYECDGTIMENGQCNGTLTPVDYSKKENWCYVFQKWKGAGHVCFSTALFGGYSYNRNGTYYKCESNDDGKIFVMTIDEYNNICGSIDDVPTYTFYQNVSDPYAMPLSKIDAIIHCDNTSTSSNACEFAFKENPFSTSLDLPKNLRTKQAIKRTETTEKFLSFFEAIMINYRMVFGENGKTVTKYSNGKTLIIKNNVRYECYGKIEPNDECYGQLTPLNYDIKENFCYMPVNKTYEDRICVSSEIILIFGKQNNEFTCISNEKTAKTLIMKVEEYENMCRDMDFNPTYKYTADIEDPLSIMIPYPNHYVECQNNENNVCVFKFNNITPPFNYN